MEFHLNSIRLASRPLRERSRWNKNKQKTKGGNQVASGRPLEGLTKHALTQQPFQRRGQEVVAGQVNELSDQ